MSAGREHEQVSEASETQQDSLLSQAISATSGQSVPTKTTSAAVASRMLFSTSALSRDTIENTPFACIAPARAA